MPNKGNLYLLLSVLLVVIFMRFNFVTALPTAVELGGAIVAAVEEEEAEAVAAAAAAKDKAHGVADASLQSALWNSGNFVNLTDTNELSDFVELQNFSAHDRFDEARGKKHKKKDKMFKHLYPLFIGTLLAKTILVPLILKMLTAISTSSFIMAKIALAASGLLALKWIFASGAGNERSRVEIVQIPAKSNTIDLGDLTWSGSNYVDVKTPTPKQRLKYIPLKGGNGVGSGSTSITTSSSFLPSLFGNSKENSGFTGYKYNYDKHLDGKPFL